MADFYEDEEEQTGMQSLMGNPAESGAPVKVPFDTIGDIPPPPFPAPPERMGSMNMPMMPQSMGSGMAAAPPTGGMGVVPETSMSPDETGELMRRMAMARG